ncbi:DUF4132 domain-containing protein [Spirillospora sp. CA-294931]|uniref:DUF4132 domain-containing protein n=1 Tax=Spirillospora sp. CA-294931 TaxID=3240042 RepID=UPI003D8FE9D9
MNADVLADEDTLVIPPVWRGRLHPRRGGVGVPLAEVDATAPEAVRDLMRRHERFVEAVLSHPNSVPGLVEQARAHLRGETNPQGAAVLAEICINRWEGRYGDYKEGYALFTEAWIAEHGLAFAACALAEQSRLDVDCWISHPDPKQRVWVIRFAKPDDHLFFYSTGRAGMRRVRSLLAIADEREYSETERRLAGHRDTPVQRVVVSYLMPTRTEWVEECCAAPPNSGCEKYVQWALMCALGSVEQLNRLGSWTRVSWMAYDLEVLVTMVEGIGPALTPALVEALDEAYHRADGRKQILAALGVLPTDEAFAAMVERLDHKYVQAAALKAMKRFPVRALRILAEAATGTSKAGKIATGLLKTHLLTEPGLDVDGLSVEALAAVTKVRREEVRMKEASAGSLPAVLVSPPWTRERTSKERAVTTRLTPLAEPTVIWRHRERQEWAEAHDSGDWHDNQTAGDLVDLFHAGQLPPYLQFKMFVEAPAGQVRTFLSDWIPDTHFWKASTWLRVIAARFELEALPPLLKAATGRPVDNGEILMPFLTLEIARLMAGWLTRPKTARPVAEEWFARHGLAAANLLVPDAIGQAGKARHNAGTALLLIASKVGADPVLEVARAYGVADAIESLLNTDPLEILPARMPKIGDWAEPAVLPQIRLRGTKRALPAGAVRHLLTMLAISKPGNWYAGLDMVDEACDHDSLAEFSWRLYELWETAGSPSRDGWAFTQLGRLGDDETVRRLAPLIRTWPGRSAHVKAATGLDVLAEIGTDVALMHLHGIAEKVKFRALRTKARAKIGEIAAALELTPDQLADRLVPDFGLDAKGSLSLDYGPRRFTVGFDEQLKPYVLDQDGKRRKSLPKPGVKDDQEQAAAAYKRFAALKRDVRTVATDQIRRLEDAMVGRRRWTVTEFQTFFVSHPLLGHLARRLVWLSDDTSFRVTEDGTLADAGDDAFALSPSRIGIAHPLDLSNGVQAWAEVFADYEILQPFPQLGRPVYTLTEQERRTGELARFEGGTVALGKILDLERRGWQREAPQDAGIQGSTSRGLPGGGYVSISFDDYIAVGHVDAEKEIGLGSVRFTAPGDLDPLTASEMLAELADLTRTG